MPIVITKHLRADFECSEPDLIDVTLATRKDGSEPWKLLVRFVTGCAHSAFEKWLQADGDSKKLFDVIYSQRAEFNPSAGTVRSVPDLHPKARLEIAGVDRKGNVKTKKTRAFCADCLAEVIGEIREAMGACHDATDCCAPVAAAVPAEASEPQA